MTETDELGGLKQAVRELAEIGCKDSPPWSPEGIAVAGDKQILQFRFRVEAGKFRGKIAVMGMWVNELHSYPAEAPHWILVRKRSWGDEIFCDVDDKLGGSQETIEDKRGETWTTFSRPVGSFWTRKRNMKSYLDVHITSFWGRCR